MDARCSSSAMRIDFAMATGKRLRLTVLAAIPERADGVDDVACPQASRGCGDGLSGGKTANASNNLAASLKDGGTAHAMDGEIHATPSEQGRIGGVYDGVGLLAGNVARTEDHKNAVPDRYSHEPEGWHAWRLLVT